MNDTIKTDITKIWHDVLGFTIENIDLDFFTAGGNSIQALQLITLIEERLNFKINISDFFEATTIAKLSTHLQSLQFTG
ncbi:MAG TPA: acyl carrier protein [Gammaproteobacteria bacterium]|nr:acyl carrier protein [Gammaproteobacteria bacterium]